MSNDPNLAPTPPADPPSIPPVNDPPPAPTFKEQVAALGPELADNPNISKHADLASLLKSHANAQALIGRDKVSLPNREDPHDVARFLKDLGRPDTAEGYEAVTLEMTDDDRSGWDDTFALKVQQASHDSGLTDQQHKQLVPRLVAILQNTGQEMFDAGEQHSQSSADSLRKKYGLTYDAKMAAGERAVRNLFPGTSWEDFASKQFSDGTRPSNDPAFLEALITMGDLHFVDDETGPGSGPRVPKGLDPAAAMSQIKQLEANPAYLDKDHLEHDDVNEQLNNLYAYAFPENKP